VHLPEAALQPGRLGGAGGGERAWVRRLDREVAKADLEADEARLERGAERALVVPVDDYLVSAASDVVVRTDGRQRG